MKPEKIAQLRSYVSIAERLSPDALADLHGARFDFRAGAYEMRLAGISGTSTMSREAARESWVRAARRKIELAEANCVGHVASADDAKICGRCGLHIDDLRPDEADPIPHRRHPMPGSVEAGMKGGLGYDEMADPILAGSGPVPIVPREG
ncbi:hypothetical protein [Aquamicrobium sp.]|uniref:hypothetical protein n=1 Tax=Aquamicrobium sp. TaxID=1872579 RepID=UPI002583DCCB|nr:hypothetical protein [Aquamicrobium sp.]MCK9551591.1 hypothetical protein [Aquamicrobium sp.]